MNHRIVFLDRASLIADMRAPSFAHKWINHEQTRPQDAAARILDASIVIVNKVRLTGDILARAPRVRMIALAATGTDNVDLAYCRAHGIVVCNIRGYAVHTLPEHVFMLMLALRRNLPGWQADVRAGLWEKADQFCLFTRPINDLYGSTLGLVGHGSLGNGVRRLAEAFGMNVLVAERKAAAEMREDYTPFDVVIREADVISLHTPLTAETRHMIGAREFELMKPTAILINTARGNLVDEAALADALKSGRIAGAGFDVLSIEPPRDGNPLLELDLPNFIITPHVAWSSREAMQTLADQLVGNIEAFVAGTPRNVVT
ncbi:MAG: D-2-hydroxyacid dehydrogenase [Thiobacillus sp.]|jgi:glycerate dehydrogenase|uniref:D-2-hydroxyacid dehydrogenase n=1 Tax=Thiobacillus sp. TaxID=924 RepID=UPI002893CC04|nr:D-2-hydroxyacid dehydrogenase [Thiobacillus sp.]MDT3707101.1 D-2-hydroxyacid dehydrogenase [Thiobacillus sp.]